MTNAPADLLGFRHAAMAETGLADPADVGIVGDGAHARTGGYHEGRDVLVAIGRYHPGAQYVGSSVEDYSCRLGRDRAGLTDSASALDIGASWPRGGRSAWLRFNRLLVAALQAGDPALAAIRAVNYSPDGTQRKRIDRQYGFTTVQDSTDSVDIHTHIEWYRDTEGNRQASLDRLIALVRAARDNTTAAGGGADVEQTEQLIHPTPNAPGRTIGSVFTDTGNLRDYLIGAGAAVPGDPAWPKPDSPLGRLVAFLDHPPAPVLTDAQAAVLADRVGAAATAQVDARLDALDAKLTHVLAALTAAGRAAEA